MGVDLEGYGATYQMQQNAGLSEEFNQLWEAYKSA